MKLRLPVASLVAGIDLDDSDTWPEIYVCDSQDHVPAFATKLLHWVDGPVHYCDGCAARMLRVAEALGTHVHQEALPAPPTPAEVAPRRAIDLARAAKEP